MADTSRVLRVYSKEFIRKDCISSCWKEYSSGRHSPWQRTFIRMGGSGKPESHCSRDCWGRPWVHMDCPLRKSGRCLWKQAMGRARFVRNGIRWQWTSSTPQMFSPGSAAWDYAPRMQSSSPVPHPAVQLYQRAARKSRRLDRMVFLKVIVTAKER